MKTEEQIINRINELEEKWEKTPRLSAGEPLDLIYKIAQNVRIETLTWVLNNDN